MTTDSEPRTPVDNSFELGKAWGTLVDQMEYEERTESLPAWALDVFHAIAEAIEKLPAEHRNQVVAAALEKWDA